MKINSKILWTRNPQEPFHDGKYKRSHQWVFDGGLTLDASSSPEIVALPMSDPALIDPEEAFITSVSSCHMLFFLSIAAKNKLVVDCYEDNPAAVLGRNDTGKLAITSLILNPKVKFESSHIPDEATIQTLHGLAHSQCFLANSIKTKITINL